MFPTSSAPPRGRVTLPSTEGGPEAPRQPGAHCAGTPEAELHGAAVRSTPCVPPPHRPRPGHRQAAGPGASEPQGLHSAWCLGLPAPWAAPDRAGEGRFPAHLPSSRRNPHHSQCFPGRTTCNICRVLLPGTGSLRSEGLGGGCEQLPNNETQTTQKGLWSHSVGGTFLPKNKELAMVLAAGRASHHPCRPCVCAGSSLGTGARSEWDALALRDALSVKCDSPDPLSPPKASTPPSTSRITD